MKNSSTIKLRAHKFKYWFIPITEQNISKLEEKNPDCNWTQCLETFTIFFSERSWQKWHKQKVIYLKKQSLLINQKQKIKVELSTWKIAFLIRLK